MDGRCRLTQKTLQSTHALGFSRTEAYEIVVDLDQKDFVKSTTERTNHRTWQDVYKKRVRSLDLYIKLKIVDLEGQHVLILSFKKDENVGGKS